MDSPLEALRATLAARRFYVDGATKSAIADELRISRFKVARLIDRAVRDGIVSFVVEEPAGVSVTASTELATHLGIPESVVVPVASGEPTERLRELGTAAAGVVAGLLEDGDVLGMTWGRTLRAVADALPSLPVVEVVQLLGGAVGGDLEFGPDDLVRTVAGRTTGTAHLLHSPLLADTATSAAILRAETRIAATTAVFGRVQRAVVGIGSWQQADGSALRASLPEDVVTAALAAGAVADVGTVLFDVDGNVLPVPELTDRAISITADQLRAVPDVTAVVVGPDKARAVGAACRSGLVHRLVTDEATAEALLGTTTST